LHGMGTIRGMGRCWAGRTLAAAALACLAAGATLAAAALACLAAGATLAAEPRSFVCDVLSAAELTDAGDLAASPYTRLLAGGAKLRFDEKSGRFVRELADGDLPARRFVVVQRGGDQDDMVAR